MARELEAKIRQAAGVAFRVDGQAKPAADKRPDDKRAPTQKGIS
jgi:hypothetical protein